MFNEIYANRNEGIDVEKLYHELSKENQDLRNQNRRNGHFKVPQQTFESQLAEYPFHKRIIDYYSESNLNYFVFKSIKNTRNNLHHKNIKYCKRWMQEQQIFLDTNIYAFIHFGI